MSQQLIPDSEKPPIHLEEDGIPKHRFPDNAHAPLTLEKDGMPKHRFPNNVNAPLDSKEEGMPTHRIPDSEITPRDLELQRVADAPDPLRSSFLQREFKTVNSGRELYTGNNP